MPREAVVIGGGLAGMLTVRALLGHADTVTVVERDRYPDGPRFRKGVPQARHPHVLLSGGRRALEELLPGTGAAFAEAGAHRLELPRDLLIRYGNGWQHRFHEGRHALLSCSRPLLDHVVRDRVLRAAASTATRVEVVQAAEATGLLGTADRVTGVRFRVRDGGRGERELPAELVVDASGRGSRAPEWLVALGRSAPRQETVDTGLGYASRRLTLASPPTAGVYINPAPGTPRGGSLLPLEGGDWLLMLYGWRRHRPPTDEDGFLDFLASLAHPYIHDSVKEAQPRSAIHGFHNTANRRLHYSDPGGVPEGFVAVADAACSFNPVYGQGMSVVALGALALRDTLARGGLRPGLAGAAQRAVSRAADAAWLIAVSTDRPHAGSATLADRVRIRYLSRLIARSVTDPVVGAAYRDVSSLTAPPARLIAPCVALRALLGPCRPGLPVPPPEAGHGA
jgi:2-polyprenyl-6-methoxyphenol hydroxylase-like FAD-dependent oxidoreductase